MRTLTRGQFKEIFEEHEIFLETGGKEGARADLMGADLMGADLKEANLTGTNLTGAVLKCAKLSKNPCKGLVLGLDAPAIPNLHKKVYEAASQPHALDMVRWHSNCGTKHCWGGWIVTIAGDEGKALEEKTSTSVAASAILLATYPDMERLPDFFANDKTALAEMKRLAEMEAR